MNALQLKNIAAPIVALLVAWLSRKVPFIDAATWGTLIDALLTAVTVAVLGYFNRGTAVITQAASLPEVQSVKLEPSASPATVTATPNNVTK